MFSAGHMGGMGSHLKRYPVRVSITVAGIPIISVTDAVGVAPATTTSFADAVGLGLDTAVYSTTQADLVSNPPVVLGGNDIGRAITVSANPNLIIGALASGGAGNNTALTLLSNTSASAGGTVITDADVGTADMVSGIVWGISGNNVGHARVITTHTGSTSFTVTVPFPRAIAVGDEFLFVPWNTYGTLAAGIDGVGWVQPTTSIDQADASIASGAGGVAMVVDLELRGRTDTVVYFMLRDHRYNVPS